MKYHKVFKMCMQPGHDIIIRPKLTCRVSNFIESSFESSVELLKVQLDEITWSN